VLLRHGTKCSSLEVATVSKSKLGQRIGRLADADVLRLNQALLVFLGLAGSPRSAR